MHGVAGSLVGHDIAKIDGAPGGAPSHASDEKLGFAINVGFGVNLGAGTKLSNVRNDRREIRLTLGDGTRTDTGLRKMGALVGDGSELGCNVVTNPGAILAPATMVNPNETVTGWLGPMS